MSDKAKTSMLTEFKYWRKTYQKQQNYRRIIASDSCPLESQIDPETGIYLQSVKIKQSTDEKPTQKEKMRMREHAMEQLASISVGLIPLWLCMLFLVAVIAVAFYLSAPAGIILVVALLMLISLVAGDEEYPRSSSR